MVSAEGVGASGGGTWDELYRLWSEACRVSWTDAEPWMQAARKRVARNTPDDWQWLADALAGERSSFVAGVFKFQTVPGRLLGAMVRSAVLSPAPTAGRLLVVPCVKSLGARRVLQLLLRYVETGSDAEKAGAVSAVYYVVHNPRDEELDDLWERLRCWKLREFVGNAELNVRRRIIPMLELKPEVYPQELRPLIPAAIEIARSHPDAYIRHRVEVQLGATMLLMAIPDMGAR